MTRPDLFLQYGTPRLEKTAGFRSLSEQVGDEIFRAHQVKVAGYLSPPPENGDSLEKFAESLGAELAQADFEKDAGIGDAGLNLLKSVKSAPGKLLGDAGTSLSILKSRAAKSLSTGSSNLTGKLDAALENTKGRIQMAKEKVEGGLNRAADAVNTRTETAGVNMQRRAMGLPKQVPSPAASSPTPTPSMPSAATAPASAGVQPPVQTPAAAPAQKTPTPQPQVQTPPPQAATPSAPSAAPTPAAPGGAAAPEPSGGILDQANKAWQRTGLANGSAAWKIPALAGAGLMAYGGYKGLKATLGWAGQENHPSTYGSGAGPAQNVNEYGQPDRTVGY